MDHFDRLSKRLEEGTVKLARKLDIGMRVEATDGAVGEVADVVIDPVKWCVTHLVVQPEPGHHEEAHLVPIEAVTNGDGPIGLSWTTKQVLTAPYVQSTDFIPVARPEHQVVHEWDLGEATAVGWPYYPAGSILEPGIGLGQGHDYRYGELETGFGTGRSRMIGTTYDHVPNGTIEIRRASEVFSSDGHKVGHMDGFVVDPTGRITHLVLDHGHLWAHREISIPISVVTKANGERVTLSVNRESVGTFPSVRFHRHQAAAATS